MNIDEALSIMDKKHATKREIRLKKAHDYANDHDCLNNFKVMAALQDALKTHGMPIPINTPAGVALWHLLHKYVRILNLISIGENAINEPMEDSFIDLENYSELALECLQEV